MLLIAGGAAVAVSLSVLGYYGDQLVKALDEEEKIKVEPGASQEISQNITTAGQGAFLASFPEFSGGRPMITISDPEGKLVVQKSVDPPIIIEAFAVVEDGLYTLTLTNPSQDETLEATLVLDSQEAVLRRGGAISPALPASAVFGLVAGIATTIAGAIITIMDRRRLSKMKQFGDTSDLV